MSRKEEDEEKKQYKEKTKTRTGRGIRMRKKTKGRRLSCTHRTNTVWRRVEVKREERN